MPDTDLGHTCVKKLILFVLLVFVSQTGWGQITGTVVGDDNAPLMGVTIRSSAGSSVTSDIDGNFEISVPQGAELNVSFLGYRNRQVKAEPNMRVVLHRKGIKSAQRNDSLPWQVFVLVNGMSSMPFSPSVGLTIGMVRKAGWYINAMSGFGFHFKPNEIRYSTDYQLFYTGKKSDQLLSVSAGAVARLGEAAVYWYGGAGYAYKSRTYETNKGEWIALHSKNTSASDWSPTHSICIETGIMGNIKGFAISAGYELLIGSPMGDSFAHEIKIGIGGMFNCKRRTDK